MTEEERERITRAKEEVSAELAAADIGSYGLAAVDPRLEEYAAGVAAEPERHNVWEQLALRQFLRKADRYGIDRVAVQRFFTFYEGLYFPGKKGYQRYRLTPVQCFQFASVYAFWQGGKRVVRECVLYVPRKFSKTTGTASFALYDLILGDANGEIYIGANSQDQARKCFDVIRGSLRRFDTLGKRFVINKETVTPTKRNPRSSLAQCLTANARTKDGLNASTVIMDEFSQARDNSLLTVLTTSMGVRENPLTVIITTASDVFDGPFYEMLQGYKSVLLGDIDDDSLFAHIFEPDLGDAEDDEATWMKVQPHMGVTVSLDFYRQEYKNAVRNGAEAMLAFRTKLLNVYAENEQRSWISSGMAKSIAVPMPLGDIKGRPDSMVAIDLSESDDFSAVTMGMYDKDAKSFRFHTAYFFPRGALPGHPNERMYRVWADKGYLTLTDGDVIDYRAIVEYVLGLNTVTRTLGIGYDPWKSQEVVNMLAASGASNVLRGVKQTYGNFTAPVESFEHGVKTGHVFINDNPINYYCFGNAVLDTDKLENCKPVKRKHTQKIDGVITMLMCMRMFIDYER
ncbi:MAG: terminase large subunit [Roseburia sp.]|nr:terminase large subunit [Roseburia sp.]